MELVAQHNDIILARRSIVFDINKHYLNNGNTIEKEDWFAYKANTIDECIDDLKIDLIREKKYKDTRIYLISQSEMNDEDFEIDEDEFIKKFPKGSSLFS